MTPVTFLLLFFTKILRISSVIPIEKNNKISGKCEKAFYFHKKSQLSSTTMVLAPKISRRRVNIKMTDLHEFTFYIYYLTTSPNRTLRLFLTHLLILILSSATVSSDRTIHTVSLLLLPFKRTVSPLKSCNSSILPWKSVNFNEFGHSISLRHTH